VAFRVRDLMINVLPGDVKVHCTPGHTVATCLKIRTVCPGGSVLCHFPTPCRFDTCFVSPVNCQLGSPCTLTDTPCGLTQTPCTISDPTPWIKLEADPSVLAELKQQLQETLQVVDERETQLNEDLKPGSLEEVQQLEEHLTGALEELKQRRRDLEGK
jgi:hypothetical protein